MFKSTKEFDSAIKEILVKIRDGANIHSISSNISADDFNEALVECINRKYLSGINYQRTMDNKPHFSTSNVRVTYSGLLFIESN